MGFRITTNMMLNSYRYNLQGSTKKLSDARDMVLTQRNFNSYAEDPAAATQEFRLRRTLYQTYSQLNNTKNTYSKFNTAWNNLSEIKNKLIDKTAIEATIRGENGGTGEARKALAITLRETSESLIYALNQKLGDQFIFAGNDGLNVPFEWKGEDLYYRGINVRSGGLVSRPGGKEPDWYDINQTDEYGMPTNIPEADKRTENDQKWIAYYADQANYQKLKEMGGEELFIDLGMGLAESAPNKAVNGSYFNSALCGINFTGFGVDADGDPLNLALIMRELADVFQAWDEDMDPQGYNPNLAGDSAWGLSSDELERKALRLLDKLQDAKNNFTEQWVELDAQSVFLTSNQERLETLMIDTNTQILDVSQVDLAEAITNFSWQQYCYNAALKIGNQLLSQSLIDYMS